MHVKERYGNKMTLQMLGIDYEKADLDTRALFAFSPHEIAENVADLKKHCGLSGIVILSTCNRTEIYASASEYQSNLLEAVCLLKKVSAEQYQNICVERKESEAIDHLFKLACGMKSKVFGEDQIITQVKKALEMAREAGSTDGYLEKVFREAITAAKKVKSQVHLTAVQASVVETMKQVILKEKKEIAGSKCLVIGNGEIGRLAAAVMAEQKAKVTVTVRNYKTRQVEIPKGCKVVDYSDRLEKLAEYDIIISATTSPHHTLKYEECADKFRDGKVRLLIDLAVPRDISSAFKEESNVKLYDIDSLGGASEAADSEALKKANLIIQEYEDKLSEKKQLEMFLSDIQNTCDTGADVAYKRVKKPLNKMSLDSENKQKNQQKIEELMKQGTKKTLMTILFDLQKQLSEDEFEKCLNVIRDSVESQSF